MISSRFFIAAFAALTLTAPALAAGPVSFPLGAQNASGETGTATFTQKGDDVVVVVERGDGALSLQPQRPNQPGIGRKRQLFQRLFDHLFRFGNSEIFHIVMQGGILYRFHRSLRISGLSASSYIPNMLFKELSLSGLSRKTSVESGISYDLVSLEPQSPSGKHHPS